MANTYRWKHSALAAAIFVAAGLQLNDASALTLGQVRVQSNLGEPLRAIIPVSNLTPDEAQTLRANPASPDVFNAHGANYSAIMTQLQVRLQQRNDGSTVLQLSTAAPVNEPFLDLVLNTSWNGGSAVRSYAILLDPPSANANQAPVSPAQTTPAPAFAPAPAPAPVASNTIPARAPAPVGSAPATARIAPSAPVDTKMDPTVYQRASEWMRSQGQTASGQVTPAARPTRAATTATPAAARTPAASPASSRGTSAQSTAAPAAASAVTTRRGDTASSIARRHLPANVSLDQMLLALQRSNPQAFVNGNVNLLRAGVTLSIPNLTEAQSVSPQEARSLISAQTRDFNQYRNQIARSAPVAPLAPQAADTSAGMVTAPPAAPAANANSDKLELSSQQASEARRAEEARIAAQLQAKEDAARKQEAEENTRRMEQLLKEANEAARAAQVSAAAATPNPTAAAAPASPETSGSSANSTTTEASPGPTGITIEAQAPASLPTAVNANTPASIEQAPAASTTPETNSVTATTPPSAAPTPTPAPAPAPAPKAVPKPQPAPAPAPFYSMFDDDPLLPAAGGALLVLLLGWGYYRYRKGRKDQEVVYENNGNVPDSFFNSDGAKVDKTAPPAPGARTSKTGLSTGLSTGVSSMSYSPSQIDATGEGDPVLEADVLLAYGRDQQAEEVLKESEITNPSRTAIKVRLAEIYASRQDRISFEAKAQEVARLTQKTGIEWIKVAELGRNLDPNNELYKQMGSATPVAPAPDQANTAPVVPAAAPVAPVPTPAPSLTPAAVAAASTSASSAALSDLGPLSDLDFDFEQPAASKSGNSKFEESRLGSVSAAASLADLDFDLSEPVSPPASEKKLDEELSTNRGELPTINSNSLEFENLLPPTANKMEIKSHTPGVSGLDSIRSPLSAPPLDDFGFDDQSLGTPSGLPTDISTALPNPSSSEDLSHTLDLDLSSLTLDLYEEKPASESSHFSNDSTMANLDLQDFSSTDPLTTKLALAKEFLALGDSEGAKALAQEVLNLADGELQQQAQQLLKELDSH